MNVKLIISALLLASWSSVLPAQPWIPTECQPRHDKAWSPFREAMRKAGPESPVYAPKPFPQSDAEIVEDFRYGFQRMWRGTLEAEIPPDQLRIYRGIEEDRLRYRILRVNNWTPIRCLPKSRRMPISSSMSSTRTPARSFPVSRWLRADSSPPGRPRPRTRHGERSIWGSLLRT